MKSGTFDLLGAFPVAGPVVYLPGDTSELRRMLAGPYPPLQRWFHATYEHVAVAACQQGLIPACWQGGDSCGVFGYDQLQDLPIWRQDPWVLEVRSRALDGPLKAWWVPAHAIRGAWHGGVFYPAVDLRQREAELVEPAGTCECELVALTGEQITLWRNTWTSRL
jgi:hypothetical protein